MSPKPDERVFADFERKPAGEAADIAEIVRDILIVQARFAQQEQTAPMRGTHAKGIAVRAELEVLDARTPPRDPALAARLARGLFARPGVYPAVVRFANAASKRAPDSTRDVRAMSFWVEGPGGGRWDFAMNSAPTFPINDPHAFAVFLRVQAAAGRLGPLRALWSLSLRELWSFAQTAYHGIRQQRGTPLLAYQQLRYWSTVPFRHGPDEAVKYSATPHPANPSQLRREGPDFLQDELARHVNEDAQMSVFDIGVQFLDTERMTYRGKRREAAFWVENASVEWNEDEAPFHTVARLRLRPRSVLSAEETAAQYIDVTAHSTPETAPLGGINRARWTPEVSSRVARQGGVAEMPPARKVRRGRIAIAARWTAAAIVALFLVGSAAGVFYRWMAGANVPPLERVDDYRYLDQGWGADQTASARQTYYYTAQGATLLNVRYSWFINVERPFRSERVADPDHMRQLNFIVDPSPTRANPDQLPVGFGRRYDEQARDYLVDLTCSACHTGQLNITRPATPAQAGSPKTTTTAIRIDGGQAMMAVTDATMGSFTMELLGGLATTLGNPLKFNRFANRVLGGDASLSNKFRLWREVAGVVAHAGRLAIGGGSNTHWYPTQEGYGRTAAIGRISNVVFGDHLDAANYRTFQSPESYPYVWNIWKFDWEQYGAFVAQPMARNAAEALGTGANYAFVDEFGRPVPDAQRYRTSFSFDGVERIESTLRTLTPPEWPEDLLGKVDLGKAAKGRELFVSMGCLGCHGPHVASREATAAVAPGRVPANGPALPMWKIAVKPPDLIGTDPFVSQDLVGYRVDLTKMGLDLGDVRRLLRTELETQKQRQTDLIAALQKKTADPTAATDLADAQTAYTSATEQLQDLDSIDPRSVSIGEGLNILDMVIRARYYADNHYSAAEQACFNGFGMLDLPDVRPGYKPRPLEGVWATPPFLHNGSVPSLYDLLSPASERPRRFYVGTREFDPVRVGYVTAVEGGKRQPRRGEFLFDTALAGNSNSGHEFDNGNRAGVIGRKLSHEERMDLIEYLKIHRDDLDVVDYVKKHDGKYPDRPQYQFPDCQALLQARK